MVTDNFGTQKGQYNIQKQVHDREYNCSFSTGNLNRTEILIGDFPDLTNNITGLFGMVLYIITRLFCAKQYYVPLNCAGFACIRTLFGELIIIWFI